MSNKPPCIVCGNPTLMTFYRSRTYCTRTCQTIHRNDVSRQRTVIRQIQLGLEMLEVEKALLEKKLTLVGGRKLVAAPISN